MVLLESNHTLKTGQKAPDFDLPGIDGSGIPCQSSVSWHCQFFHEKSPSESNKNGSGVHIAPYDFGCFII